MPNIVIWSVALIVSFAFAGTALADGSAIYMEKCAACHGQKGEGIMGLSPALKGNKFITGSRAEDIAAAEPYPIGDWSRAPGSPAAERRENKQVTEDIKKVILEGRSGAAKKYSPNEFPIDMPKSGLSVADAEEVARFLQGDLQKFRSLD